MNRYLLDTHALIWFLEGNDQLSEKAKILIKNIDNELFISMASLWEIAIKMSIGKLSLSQSLENIIDRLPLEFIEILPIDIFSIIQIQTLPFHHKDPFDRIIIAQTITKNLSIVSIETIFDSYEIIRIW